MVGVRTNIMPAPLLSAEGMLDGHGALTIERMLEQAVVDCEGRLLVSMIDVLALLRVGVDAEILVMHFCDGSSSAVRIREIVGGGNVFLHVQVPEQLGADGDASCVGLWSRDSGPSAMMVSISAMSFASFVGLE